MSSVVDNGINLVEPRKHLSLKLRAAVRAFLDLFIRHRCHIIWEALLDAPRVPSSWPDGERMFVIDLQNLDTVVSPTMRHFLGGAAATDDLRGVKDGDRLLIVTSKEEYAFYGYIYFDTTAATRRQKRIFGEFGGTPVIGTCYTAEPYRGRGIYKRVLNDAFRYLRQTGYTRVIADVNTHNNASIKASAAAGMVICRELEDWVLFRRLLIQKVKEAGGTRWRTLVL